MKKSNLDFDVIGFLGKKGTGKDTCADYLVENHAFEKLSFAGPLKEKDFPLFLSTFFKLGSSPLTTPTSMG